MRATRLLQGVTALLGFVAAGTHLPHAPAVLDNLSNFPVHFTVAFLACSALLAGLKRRGWALVAGMAATLAFAPVLPWYAGADADGAPPPFVKLLVSNVNHANLEHERIHRLVATENPDVVGLVEVNARWLRKLKALRAEYPYHFEVPDEHYVGLALYSRLPLANARVLKIDDPSTPAIIATLKTPTGGVDVILAHPMSPLSAQFIRRRNEQVLALARYVSESGKPTVLAGDLNLTMWNRGYRPLAEIARLHNARRGHGVGPTWPAIGKFGVPIDHILASPTVELRGFRVLTGVGSDHLPVLAEFNLR